ncbi:hypothetical protein [Streptomyces ochraceiscleroticus]|uniref:Uncharacterized protein n=1 Tax=Streptomyces ochraceiscleroticus TaxID=47761 RepID=A0ABW1MV45_9ACTN|nr:hypothetical protein [Streptomyces ochraceiscleroticus]
MTAQEPRVVLDRIRGITWDDDFSVSLGHARSRALLMREYLRRAALWAQAYGAEVAWPFFGVAEYAAPEFEPAPELATELEEYASHLGTPSLRRVCRGAVRWAALRENEPGSPELSELPDPYEPLLLMFGRGGYSVEEFIDLYGVLIPHGSLNSNLRAEPFLTLAASTLGVGRESETYDEVFTRNLRWEPTDYLTRFARHVECGQVRITEPEAAAVIEKMTG